MEGKSTKAVEQPKSEPMVVDDTRIAQVFEILESFSTEMKLSKPPPNNLIFGKSRSADLKNTKSYSCNALIKIFHLNKPDFKFPDFVKLAQSRQWPENVKIEDSGYLTVINKDTEEATKVEKPKKLIEEIKTEIDPKQL